MDSIRDVLLDLDRETELSQPCDMAAWTLVFQIWTVSYAT
ncbi:MAG: hypothetical protein QOE54_5522 [Streptosporangiaceae bacterium]|jgi:hypothetical protein|nr:hypothetical protein [Streptosporangiaceae bacterium]